MRVLPRSQREAMFEIYAFCREVDDIADSRGPRPVRRQQLDHWRGEINSLYGGKPTHRTQGLAAPVRDFALRYADLAAATEQQRVSTCGASAFHRESICEPRARKVRSSPAARIHGLPRASWPLRRQGPRCWN
jgi:hypothetical protein